MSEDFLRPPPIPPCGSSAVRPADAAPTASERRETRLRLVVAIAPRLAAHNSRERTIEETRRLVCDLENFVFEAPGGACR